MTGTALLMTGNKVLYSAKGLHTDRYNKQKATVEIRFQTPESDDYLSYDDIDIRDREQRNRLANAARKHLDGPKGTESMFDLDVRDWTESVNQHLMDEFCLKFPLVLFEAQGARWGSAGDAIQVEDFLIPDFLQGAGGHVLYGPKGSGKTEIGIILARCLQFGIDLFGPVTRCVTPMFLQLERSEQSFLRAVQLVNRAIGLSIDEPILYRVERGRSLAGMIDAIASDVDKNKVDVLITDSVSRMAEGGSLKDDDTANTIMDRLNGLAPCHFDLGHTSWEGKGDPEKAHVFGSIHFGNAADVVTQILRQRIEQRKAGVMLKVTDANAFSPGEKRYYSAEYDELGLLRFSKAGADDFPELGIASGLSVSEKRQLVFDALPLSRTVADIAEDTGMSEEDVNNTLRGAPRLFTKMGAAGSMGRRGRPAVMWGRLTTRYEGDE